MFRLLDALNNVVFAGLITAALVPFAVPIASQIEGRVFPVVTDAMVFNLRYDGEYTTVDATFNKRRDCDFDGLVWYINTGAFYKRIRINFPNDGDDSDQTRATGQQIATDWKLKMKPEDLEGSFAELRHICHPLWRTRTRFFPPILG